VPNSLSSQNNPIEVSDRQAYSLFFRLLATSSNSNDDSRKQVRSYLKYAGFGKKKCSNCAKEQTDESDVDSLLAMANEFQQRVSVLDKQAAEIKRQNRINPSPILRENLAQLQRQKDTLVDEIYFSLPRRISKHADDELKRFISEDLKKKINVHQGGVR
jgi:uncharacterized protein YdiU (UPF0061 family)